MEIHPQAYQKDISEFINLESPILKYLIEIEKKYWSSEVNQSYKFPYLNSQG